MSANRLKSAIRRAYMLIDYNIHDNFHKQHKFIEQAILADKSLTEEEKTKAIILNSKDYDRDKICFNSGIRRICENCDQECLATLYCEYCVRNYLKVNFSNWSSENNDIDNLIKNCQMETLHPQTIVEWIPYNNLRNVKYLTKGGFSEIYTATWIGGRYNEWDTKKQQLIRFGNLQVILKELGSVESANRNWFEEAKSHLTISNKYITIVQCFGLTQNPSSGNYMLVMRRMNINLREYLQQNHVQLKWEERIHIVYKIIQALCLIHEEKSIHRDLHSGNILYSQLNDSWRVSDLGFCGPADKPSTSIYGNLPYIAPEIFSERKYTFKSDIYSIAILMWEISSGQLPFMNYNHDHNLAINIINGMRPKILPNIPSKYKSLMEQCWDANPLKRPNTYTLLKKIKEIMSYYQNNPNELPQQNVKIDEEGNNLMSNKLFTSKIYRFENLPEPKNATEEQKKAFYTSKLYDFTSIPDNISNLGKSSKQYTSINYKDNKDNDKESPRSFKRLKLENVDLKSEREITQQRSNIDINDDVHNNPNLRSEKQGEF